MREYICAFGHVHMRLPGKGGCPVRNLHGEKCPAPVRRTGKVGPPALADHRVLAIFMAHVEDADLWACWPWTGLGHDSTPRLTIRDNVLTSASRAAYEMWVGPLPRERKITSLCRTRGCVNPWHYQPGGTLRKSKR